LLFFGSYLRLFLEDDLLVVLLRIKPGLPVTTQYEKERIAVAIRVDQLADICRERQAILIVYPQVILADEQQMPQGFSFHSLRRCGNFYHIVPPFQVQKFLRTEFLSAGVSIPAFSSVFRPLFKRCQELSTIRGGPIVDNMARHMLRRFPLHSTVPAPLHQADKTAHC
jgi:hypothetical protein